MNEQPIDLTDAKIYYLVTDGSDTILWRKEATLKDGVASISGIPKKYQKHGMHWQYQLHTQDGSIQLLKYGSYPRKALNEWIDMVNARHAKKRKGKK